MALTNHVAQAMNLAARTAPEAGIFKFRAPATGALVRIKIWSSDVMAAGGATFDLNKNGVTVFTTQSNRPTIPEDFDNAVRNSGDMDITSITKDDIITVDFDEFPGSETSTGVLDIVIEMSEA
jgi:hypothetical protein